MIKAVTHDDIIKEFLECKYYGKTFFYVDHRYSDRLYMFNIMIEEDILIQTKSTWFLYIQLNMKHTKVKNIIRNINLKNILNI